MSRPSLRQAINDFCRQCIHDPEAPGTWRAQVDSCVAQQCPLFQVRPRASKADRLTLVQNQAVTAPKRRSQ